MYPSSVLREGALNQLNHHACCHHCEAGTVPESGHAHSHGSSQWSKIREALTHAGHEFFDMGKYLIIGAIIAALFKTLVPQDVIAQFSGNIFLAIFGMMALAILLSVCSEADAFVAASFVSFPAVAKLSFVTIGPMVDLKLIGMFAATFQKKVFRALLIGPVLMIFFMTWILGLLI